MKILYVGKVVFGNACYSRFRGFQRNNFDVSFINIEKYKLSETLLLKLIPNKRRYNLKKLNNDILSKLLEGFDFVLFDQFFYLEEMTVDFIKQSNNTKIILHFTDDIEYVKHGLLLDISVFKSIDYIFTCNRHSIKFLKEKGVKNLYFNELGYDDEYIINKSKIKFENSNIRFGFIGHYEKSYLNQIDLIQNSINEINSNNLSVNVYGSGWFRNTFFKRKTYLKSNGQNDGSYGSVSHDNYWNLINSFDIGIGLFSSINRNNSSGRTFEIPASNTLLLTKKSEITSSIFKNLETAIFWNPENIDEIIDLIKNDRSLMQKICKNGFEFVNDSKFRWVDRVKEMVNIITN